MTRLFRSKSCGLPALAVDSFFSHSDSDDAVADGQEEQEFDDYGDEYDDDYGGADYYFHYDRNQRITTPFISPDSVNRRRHQQGGASTAAAAGQSNSNHFTVLTLLVAALRKSLVTCSVDTEDVSSTASSSAASDIQIGGPTDVKHLSHVTFDRFNGFLGLPLELQPDVPRKVPSASVSVFGVSAESMQCSYDQRGNSVPTILLMMQKRLYSGGGLQAEGVFRINAENSQEEHVRKQLNRGLVPQGIDVHCLAGLIKAWFRELPRGVLDSLTPEQVMHCNTEEECTQLVKSLPPTEAALLDWAINLMADVVNYEHENKMNARNIAMVFAPNMTQMADPLTALIHAVQVMNLLKTLIMKTLREREEGFVSSCGKDSPTSKADPSPLKSKNNATVLPEQTSSEHTLLRSVTLDRLESESEEKFWSFPRKSNIEVPEYEYASSGKSSPAAVSSKKDLNAENGFKQVEVEGILERLSLRKGVRKLCRHPVFQLSKTVKKNQGDLGIVSTRGRGGEAWV